MFTIAKEFQFDACHLLDGHNKKCHNLHGHTYRLFVEVSGHLINEGSSESMVLDFSDLKTLVKQHIIDKFDHAYLYDQTNTNECRIANVLIEMDRKVFAFNHRTTAEELSRYIFNTLAEFLPISMVKLWETPTSYCEYRRGGQ